VEGHHIKIERIDSVIGVVVDGNMIDHVSDYKITNSADGTTELNLKFVFKSDVTKFETSAIQKQQTS
jgi:hypothetical protein